MTAIRTGLDRDYRSITEQSIPSSKAKQALSRTPLLQGVFFARGEKGSSSSVSRQQYLGAAFTSWSG
jgi:hypothetical protein